MSEVGERFSRARRSTLAAANDAKESEACITLLQDANALEIADGLRQVEVLAMLGDDETFLAQQNSKPQKGQNTVIIFGVSVRRIEKNNRGQTRPWFQVLLKQFEAVERVHSEDSRATSDFERFEVFTNQSCGGCMALDENSFDGSAAKGFDSDSACSGEHVDEPRTGDMFAENIEQGFAKTVAGGAQGHALKTLELAAAEFSGNHTHVSVLTLTNTSQMITSLPFGR